MVFFILGPPLRLRAVAMSSADGADRQIWWGDQKIYPKKKISVSKKNGNSQRTKDKGSYIFIVVEVWV